MRGNLFIVSAPSGTGKTALVAALLEKNPGLHLSISYTTREKRSTEVEGIHYFFTDEAGFLAMQDREDFLESAQYKGNLYGTRHQFVENSLSTGQDVILEIDVQGAQQVKARIPESVGIFLLPPSRQELERRLRNRARETGETEEDIQRRLALAHREVSYYRDYDHIIINEVFEDSLALLQAVVQCHATSLDHQAERIEGIIASFGGAR